MLSGEKQTWCSRNNGSGEVIEIYQSIVHRNCAT